MNDKLKCCQSCLSTDRLLCPLVNLKLLLKCLNIQMLTEGGICWECRRIMEKFSRLKLQVCQAQRELHGTDKNQVLKTLSTLSVGRKTCYDSTCFHALNIPDWTNVAIKQEILDSAEENDDDCVETVTDKNQSYSNNERTEVKRNAVAIWSDLAKITSIETIVEPLESEEQQDIIELNIPLPPPAQEDGRTNCRGDKETANTEVNELIHPSAIKEEIVNVEEGATTNTEAQQNQSTCRDALPALPQVCVTLPSADFGRRCAQLQQDHQTPDGLEHYTEEHQKRQTQPALPQVCVTLPSADFGRRCAQLQQDHQTPDGLEHYTEEYQKRQTQPALPQVCVTLPSADFGRRCAQLQQDHQTPDGLEHYTEEYQKRQTQANCKQESNLTEEELSRASDLLLWKKSIMLVYNSLRSHKYASHFLQPISDAVAPNYSKIIKRPMDLNTIRRSIRNGRLSTTAQVQNGMLLMLTNSLMYNDAGHYIHNMTKDLMEEVQLQFGVLIQVQAQSALPDDTPTSRPKRHRENDTNTLAKRQKTIRTQNCSKAEIDANKRSNKTYSSWDYSSTINIPNATSDPEAKNKINNTININNMPLLPKLVIKLEKMADIDRVIQQQAQADKESRRYKPSHTEGHSSSNDPYSPQEDLLLSMRHKQPRTYVRKPKASKEESRFKDTEIQSSVKKTCVPAKEKALRTYLRKIRSTKKEMNNYSRKPRTKKKANASTNESKSSVTEPSLPINEPSSTEKPLKITSRARSTRISRKPMRYEDIPIINTPVKNEKVNKRKVIAEKKQQTFIKAPRAPPNKYKHSHESHNPIRMSVDLDKWNNFAERTISVSYRKHYATDKPEDLRVAITTDNSHELTNDQANTIKTTLEDKILCLAFETNNFAPMFREKAIISDGVIKLWCEDRQSMSWLTETVAKLPENLGRLVIKKQADLPKKLRSSLSVPGCGDMDVIRLLRAQNPWAKVDSWALYSSEQRGESTFFELGIPSTALPVLMGRGRRLAYNSGSVYVRFYSTDGLLGDEPPVILTS